jgi:hypothetical protein
MGDGQECQICRKLRRHCECKAPFEVVATWKCGKTLRDFAYNRREVRELCDWFRMREKCDGVYVNRHVEGIGYVLDE